MTVLDQGHLPRPGTGPRSWWWTGRTIVTRLVVSVAVAMAVVLLMAAGFVYWRVEFALNRQLNQDLQTWASVVNRDVMESSSPPTQTPGFTYQVYGPSGRLEAGSPGLGRLASPQRLSRIERGADNDYDLGSFLPPGDRVYRVRPTRVLAQGEQRVVLAVVSRSKHDEALRELMLQLAIGNLVALVAASFVGYRTARGALNPVEAYRRAAEGAHVGAGERLPVDDRKDDELTRLGHTLNDLLGRIDASTVREREFLADAAHELRTPLTLMTTELEWAEHRQRSPEEMREVIGSLRGQVGRLVGLANMLLDIEELRAGSGLLRRPVDLRDLVLAAVHDALPHDAQVRVDIRGVDTGEDAGLVEVDPRWVSVALSNLLRNALRHGAAPIEVVGVLHHDAVDLVVHDHGAGFPEAFKAHAFERFTRAEESRSTPGTGLGLYLVEVVAEAHGGRVDILDGPGAAVRVRLPVAAPPVTGALSAGGWPRCAS